MYNHCTLSSCVINTLEAEESQPLIKRNTQSLSCRDNVTVVDNNIIEMHFNSMCCNAQLFKTNEIYFCK